MSKIEWTTKTWNPIAGCSKVSEGCRNCYAERMSKRLAAMGRAKYNDVIDDRGLWNGKIVLDEKALMVPLNTRKPTVFFVNSMSDLFHENMPDEWIARIFDVMYRADWHTFQILTKRPQRMRDVVTSHHEEFNTHDKPPRHIWLGVSVENQQVADERIPLLLETPAGIRFLSCEPLLGPVDLNAVRRWGYPVNGAGEEVCYGSFAIWQEKPMRAKLRNGIDWVIVGGESGPGARPMHPDWARSLRDQCKAADVAFFFKQWGEWAPGENAINEVRRTERTADYINDEWHYGKLTPMQSIELHVDDTPDVYRLGKKNAYRTLDGVEHNQMPCRVIEVTA